MQRMWFFGLVTAGLGCGSETSDSLASKIESIGRETTKQDQILCECIEARASARGRRRDPRSAEECDEIPRDTANDPKVRALKECMHDALEPASASASASASARDFLDCLLLIHRERTSCLSDDDERCLDSAACDEAYKDDLGDCAKMLPPATLTDLLACGQQ